MKKLHKVDGKGRFRPGVTVKKFLSGGEKKVIFYEDRMVIICNKDVQTYASNYAKEIGDPKLARILLDKASINYAVDNQGRLLIPEENRKDNLKGKELYFFTIEDEGVKSVEIYEKETFEKKVSKYYSVENKGLKNLEKGNERWWKKKRNLI